MSKLSSGAERAFRNDCDPTVTWVAPIVVTVILIAVSTFNYLLFHMLAEAFAVFVTVMMLATAWYTYPHSRNAFFMFLACGYFWIGMVDLLHAFAYKGMGIFPDTSANMPTQLWLVARYGEAVLLLTAPLFQDRSLDRLPVFLGFGGVFTALGAAVATGWFPVAFVDGLGLTPFKVWSEYVIVGVLVLALLHFLRHPFGKATRGKISAAVLLTIAAELAFTTYVGVYDYANLAGHIFKLLSFWLIFDSIIQSNLEEPYHQLEHRVEERTAELQRSEARAHRLLQSIADGFIALDTDWRITYLSQRGEEILQPLGKKSDDLIGRVFWDVFPEVIGSPFKEIYRQIEKRRATASVEAYYPPLDAWLNVRAYPSDDGVAILFVDVTESKLAEERQRLLMREVDHRAKNTLAVVQSVVQLTKAGSIKEFVAAVQGRVAALARTHSLLASNRWNGANLEQLIAEELAPYLDGRAHQANLSGPPVEVTAEAVQSMGMVFHELATNAAKYGALSVRKGRVEVHWDWLESGDLSIVWRETGGPPIDAEPMRRGFGSTMIDRSAVSFLGGAVEFAWRRNGLCCMLTVAGDRICRTHWRPYISSPPNKAVAAKTPFAGFRVLVVEDDPLIAIGISEDLRTLGYEPVGPIGDLEGAIEAAKVEPGLKAAVLDISLHGDESWPVADALRARGIPYLFATGYGDLAEDSGGVPVLEKPFASAKLAAALLTVLQDHAARSPLEMA